MMGTPRTPEFFPRMKVRGARRRRIAPFQRFRGSLKRMTRAAEIAAREMTALTQLTERRSDD